ncbi:MAG: LysM peptidoglycan-binding domain-containing protein [Eudoraea sp.]|nr:LysM peptidoglycan-binding domain-containing protein [Eudoraea sp.]
MKQALFTLVIASLLMSCGAKKRASRKASKQYEVMEAGTYPMPENTGKFVRLKVNSVEEYVSLFSDFARHEMELYGIPASITLAQGMLESGIGIGPLALKSNNHFGIKCHNGWEGQRVYHDDDTSQECFRKYNHPLYSFRDHSIFLSSRVRYSPLFKLKRDDYKGWARGLKKAGYATDPKYANKLISFIERYDLNSFDSRKKRVIVANDLPDSRDPNEPVEYQVHKVIRGDTLYSLAQRYFVPIADIMRLNNMETSIISVGQVLRIRKK